MAEVFLKIVNMSISAGWLVLAVVALRFFLKKAPKWVNVLLWGIVAVRLLWPFSIESALSLIPSAEVISPEIMTDRTPQITTGIPAINSVVNPVIMESFAPEPAASANPLQIWIPVVSVLWLLGMAAMVLYTAVSYFRLRRKVQTAVWMYGNIYQSAHIPSPFVLGILKPKIYLPYCMAEANMAHVIAHEQTHIRRKDHWWKPLGFLLLTIHWFNPLMWAAYILLCRDIELACDEKVIKELGRDQRADYSQALLSCSVDRKMIAACPLAFGEVGVTERVKNVLNYKKPAFWVIVISVVLCVALAVCFLTNPDTPDMDVLPLIHSHGYSVAEYAYEYPLRSFHYVPGVNTPVYAITEDMELLEIEDPGTWEWTSLGTLEKAELTGDDFGKLFGGNERWLIDETAASFRKNNANVWSLVSGADKRYYVFQQKDGEIYLGFGYFDPDNSPHEFDCFKLAVDVTLEQGVVAASGEYAVPLTIFPAGTAVGNYENSVQWLTIAPYGDGEVPFALYRDGEETEAHYFIYDTETYEPLPHMVYQDVPSQTNIFENADIHKRYIIVAVFSAEADADHYCFGVQFQNTDHVNTKGAVIEWIDDESMDIYSLDGEEITLSNFQDVTFCYTPGQITAEDEAGEHILISGMPICNAYLTDLTGDGYPEICATVSYGSGLVDTHVVVYDYANGQEYTLWDRGIYDYYLRVEDGMLLCDQFTYANGGPMDIGSLVASGELILADAGGGDGKRLTIDLQDTKPGSRFITSIVDRTVTEQLPTAEAVEVFYEDEQYVYSFPSIRSHYVMVTYNNGNSEDIQTALAAGRASIADLDTFGISYFATPKDAGTVMQPTDADIHGLFGEYLYRTIDGKNYRYERQSSIPEGVTAGEYLETLLEGNGLGKTYRWEVYAVEGCTDDTMVMAMSPDMPGIWLYQYSPPKRAEEGALQGARDAGYVIMEDGRLTGGEDAWYDFYESTQNGNAASVRVVHYYTLDPETTADITYEAYQEDYPRLYTHELSYDGEIYTLRWEEYGTEYVRTYEYLMKYTGRSIAVSYSAIDEYAHYVLTHDNTVTWEQLLSSMTSSVSGAYIDHYTICTELS